MTVVELRERLAELLNSKKRWRFTLEMGQGETYRNNNATLYGHSTYERSSVLAGRTQRVFIAQWQDWHEARSDLVKAGIKYEDMGGGGTSHIPIDQIVS